MIPNVFIIVGPIRGILAVAALQQAMKQVNERDDELARLHTKVEGLEYQVDSFESCIKSYKPFRNCRTIHDVFCLFDSMEGRAIAAEEIAARYEEGRHER